MNYKYSLLWFNQCVCPKIFSKNVANMKFMQQLEQIGTFLTSS